MTSSSIQDFVWFGTFNIVLLYTYHCFFSVVLSGKSSRFKYATVIYITYFFLSDILFFKLQNPYFNMLMGTIFLFMITQFYNAKQSHKIIAVLFAVSGMAGIEIIITNIYSFIVGARISDILTQKILYYIYPLFQSLFH